MSTLAEVLAEHRPVHDPNGHINGTVPGSVAVYDCQCGLIYNVTLEECLEHQVWMITTAGLVVIELPEPPWKYALGAGDIEDIYSRDGLVVVSGVDAISPAYARELAAAFLAAANAAEQVSS